MCVTLRPARAYRALASQPGASMSPWSRPLFFAFTFGCVISLLASGRLTLRLVATGTLYAALIPLVEIAVVAILWRGARAIRFARAVDLFFMGHGPWIAWLLILSAVWSFFQPTPAFAFTRLWFYAALPVAVWSAYVDLCFFRFALQYRQAGRALIFERLFCWVPALIIFGGSAVLPEAVRIFGG